MSQVNSSSNSQNKMSSTNFDNIQASVENKILKISGSKDSIKRKILYVNSYGMAKAWRLWERGVYPGHHLWGCLELAAMGYEILIPEPTHTTGILKRLITDFRPAMIAAFYLSADDIVYCAHNVLLWVPFLKMIKVIRCKVVGLLFAQEPLPFASVYDGIIGHTPVASAHAASIAPRVLCRHISWGVDLSFFRFYPYEPQFVLSCGKTFRDFDVIAKAWTDLSNPLSIVHPDPGQCPSMSDNVSFVSAREIGEDIYVSLVNKFYRYTTVSLLTMVPDTNNRHTIGITNLFESMAAGRPVIVTRTSALTSEIDVEAAGIGIFVQPSNPTALKQAVEWFHENPQKAAAMGERGRQLCEQHYNIERFASDLHNFFEEL